MGHLKIFYVMSQIKVLLLDQPGEGSDQHLKGICALLKH